MINLNDDKSVIQKLPNGESDLSLIVHYIYLFLKGKKPAIILHKLRTTQSFFNY